MLKEPYLLLIIKTKEIYAKLQLLHSHEGLSRTNQPGPSEKEILLHIH